MPVVIPHTFTSNTNIEGPEVQANNNAIKNWLNGGFRAAPTDVLTSKWIKASQIMNGYYNAIINQFEFTTGLVQGNPEFPKFNPGGTSVAIGDANSDLTVTGSGFILVPRTSCTFTLEADAKVVISIVSEMFPLDDDTGTYSDDGKSTMVALAVDGTVQNATKHIAQAMMDVGASGGTGDFIPLYEGQRQFHSTITLDLAKGDHTIGLAACSNEQITWISRYSLSLECYY